MLGSPGARYYRLWVGMMQTASRENLLCFWRFCPKEGISELKEGITADKTRWMPWQPIQVQSYDELPDCRAGDLPGPSPPAQRISLTGFHFRFPLVEDRLQQH